MKLGSSFSVPTAPDKVVALFLDAQTMQSCIPGCEELAQVDEAHYQGVLVNEVAHVRFTARFTAEITSVTAPANHDGPHIVKAVLKGEDRRLGSTIKVDAKLTVAPHGGSSSSEVDYELELAMWGKLGRLGESVIRRRSMEVERQFVEALTAVCSGQPVPQSKPRQARKASPAATPLQEAEAAACSGLSTRTAADPVARPREDWVVLGLSVAAAFAYGLVAGGRSRRHR